MEICKYSAPAWKEIEPEHFCACHLYDTESERTRSLAETQEAKKAEADKK
jgi:peptide/nickel transport system ATP-binding protein